jgi:UDP-glucose-4-epimerase GalE
MRVLVTGGAGFVGSTTSQRLLEAGHSVVVYDSMVLGHTAATPPGAKLVTGDIADRGLVERTLREHDIEAVIHCAGFSLVGESVQQPQKYFDNNVSGGIAFLDGLQSAGVRRIVFSSSAAVYGDPQSTPITEEQPLRPINPYGATKVAVENALASYAGAYGWNVVSLRYFNAAGATNLLGEVHEPEAHLIPNILAAVAEGRRVQIFGNDYPTPDGTCVRDYVHVDDLAAAHAAALEFTAGDESGHTPCNLGSGSGYSNLQVLAAAETVLGRKIEFDIKPRRAGDPPVLVASNERARKLLGWAPRRDLEDMVQSAWQWRQAHPNGYGPAQ